MTFQCDTINRFLTFARILDPRSKLGTFDRLDSYYEKPSFEYQHILRFMDLLEDNYDGYLEHLFLNSANIIKRDTSLCYFDCTNYYFEIEQEDDEYVDEVTGEILNGLRRYGLSKQHQPSPLVQTGLFMDGNGIPISMCINPGSDNEQKCALPLEKKNLKMFQGKPFIYCADAGLGSYDIRKFNSMGGRAFIVAQSVKKLSDTLQKAVFNDYDYRRLSNNSLTTVNEMKSFDRFQQDNLPLYDDSVYKVLTADKAVDTGLIDNEEKYDGYYAIATNLNDDVKTILEINSQRYKIEDCFRVLKTNFNSRPVHHRNRITRHC